MTTQPEVFFPGIAPIKYEGPTSSNPLAYKHYNADEVVMGKKMSEWLRFSVCYWHTFRGTGMDPFGASTIHRAWEDGSDSVENAKRRLRACFEFLSKLGVPFWCFHDRDIAPEGNTLEETNQNLDQVVALAKQLQDQTGIKLLWGTANLFSHPRFASGAASSPSFHTYARAAAQVKKAIEVTAQLGGQNFVFWNGRDGYQTVLNKDIKREMAHIVAFYRMAIAHCDKIGFHGQLLIEPKPREPLKHQYDYDAQTTIGFLVSNNLHHRFKLNIEPNHTMLAGHDHEHDILFASKLGMLGSIDSNTGDPMLGWDTDQFPTDVRKTALVMKVVLEQGGLGSGGLNFDSKLRRESTDLEDLFIAHIGAMDTYAHGLKVAAKIINEQRLGSMVSARYASWDQVDLAKRLETDGNVSLEEMEAFVKAQKEEPAHASAKQELFEMVFNQYL